MKKEKKILIFAPIKTNSNKLKDTIILLTTFSKIFGVNNYYENQKLLCANYHWNSKKKFQRDKNYILKIYEIYLKKITVKLNKLQNTNYSFDYWRIIVGPWLLDFITIIFDRFEILNFLDKKYKILEVRSATYNKQDNIFNDYLEFNSFLGKNYNQFNNIIFSEIIKYRFKKIPIKKIYFYKKNKDIKNIGNRINFFHNILRIYNFIFKLFVKSRDVFIINSYFRRSFNFRLQIKLGQFPFFWNKTSLKEQKVQWNLRELFNQKENNKFFDMLNYLIPKFIPKIYLEGYKEAVKLTNNLAWPKKPKAIISANSYFLDDVFKIWVAKKKLEGSNLISTQHGGNFFSSMVNSNEIHLKKISDYFLTWGQVDNKNKSIIPYFNFKTENKKINYSKFGNLLLFDYIMPPFVENLQSTYNGPQNLLFLNRKITFLKNLKKNIVRSTFIRNKDLFNETLLFERKLYTSLNININYSSKSFYKEIKKSRICVCNSNQTVFLETLNLNFPTIVFFDSKFDLLNKSALPYYNILRENKIFFEDSAEAAAHINKIWDNVDQWWKHKKVQRAVNLFCNKFSKRTESLKLHKFLNKLNFKKPIKHQTF